MLKSFFQRSKYLGYYLKTLDTSKYRKFKKYVREVKGISTHFMLFDILFCIYKYNIGIIDYFEFRFFEKKHGERHLWAGTGFMYEYQLKMNPRETRAVLEDKIRFLNYFKPFINRSFADLNTLESNPKLLETFLSNRTGKVVLKGSHGQIGAEVEVISCKEYSSNSLIDHMKGRKYDLLEEYVVQHPALMTLSPSGLNTIRIFTQLYNGQVEFLGARLRVSVNSPS